MALEFEIKETFISVNDGKSDWNLELNLVSWNNREPKYDLRKWSPDHEKMGKGVTMNESEAILLFQHADDFLDKFKSKDSQDIPDVELPFDK